MEKEQAEKKIVSNGIIDLYIMPKDILDMIVAIFETNIEKVINNAEKL